LNKAETLLEIKGAEAEIRAAKEAAGRERDRIAREARREALELQERLRHEADERAGAILGDAEAALAKEREAILAKGRQQADALRAAGMANVDRALEVVLTKFQGALDA
jgi:V/A-type H+-transporting ATPase subunit G/H